VNKSQHNPPGCTPANQLARGEPKAVTTSSSNSLRARLCVIEFGCGFAPASNEHREGAAAVAAADEKI